MRSSFKEPEASTLSILLLCASCVASSALAQPKSTSPGGSSPKVTFPRLIRFVPAVYPESARKAGREGAVKLVVVVEISGKVRSAQVVGSAGKDLDEAARQAVLKFVYTPALVDGKPMAARILVSYPFRLRAGKKEQHKDPASRPARPPRPGPVQNPRPDPAPKPAQRTDLLLASLSGLVLEKGSRRPLEDAEILLYAASTKNQGKGRPSRPTKTAHSDAKGRFEITKILPGKIEVVIRVGGCYPFKAKEALGPGTRLKVKYYVERRSDDPYQTVVTGKVERKEVSRYVVTLPEIEKIPGTQSDAVRAIQNMPGVARASFGMGDLIIRGSAPWENRIFVNGHEIPMLLHFEGGPSVVNSDVLQKIVFLPGNFSVRYGRAVGGVVELVVRPGKTDRWHGYVDLDLWDGGFLLEGPVGKGSLLLSARRSWIDGVLSLIPKEKMGMDLTLAPAYYDYQAFFEYPLALGRFSVLAFGSDDRMKLLFDEPTDMGMDARSLEMTYMFHRVIAAWKLKKGDNRFEISVSPAFIRQDFWAGPSLRIKLDTAGATWRMEYERKIRKYLTLMVGGVGVFVRQWADYSIPPITQEGEDAGLFDPMERLSARQSGNTVNQALYAEIGVKPFRWAEIIGGVRTDILKKGPMSAVVFDPRLTVKLKPLRRLTITAAVGLFHQEPDISDVLKETGGNPEIAHVRSLQTSVGILWRAARSLSVEATGFYKYLFNTMVRSDRLIMRDGVVTEENIANLGKGRIYGAELLVRKNLDSFCPGFLKLTKCFGWLAYTLSRSERKDGPNEPYRLFDYDQTHVLTFVLSGQWPRGWGAGLRFRLSSGNPVTPMGRGIFDSDADTYIGIPGRTNSERMPMFHQLDLRLDKKFTFNKWFLTLYLDVQNVYNNQAKETTVYNFNYTQKGYVKGLPIIPSIGIKGSF